MSGGLRLSTSLPNCKEGKAHPHGSVTSGWFLEVAKKAEILGYDALWVNELLQVQGERFQSGVQMKPPNYFDPLITIAYVASVTKTIRFVTGTLILPHHHPVLLSRQVTTLDNLTEGRITLGVGLGGRAESYKRLRGELDGVHRGKMMDEYIAALRVLWEQPAASFEGQYVRLDEAESYPKPVQRPLPILAAGPSEAALRRVALLCDGWIDSHHVPEQIREARSMMDALRPAGKPPVSIARQFYVSMANSVEGARVNLSNALHGAEPPSVIIDPEERRIVGTREDVLEHMLPYAEAGVDELCVIFYGDSPEIVLEQMQVFSEEVAPTLRNRYSIQR